MTQENKARDIIKEKIGMALGEASMCWSETPSGVFDSSKKLAKKKMYAPIAGYKDGTGAFIAGAIFDSKEEALAFQGLALSEPIGVQEIEVEMYV